MLRYEVLFFTAPEITADEATAIEKQVEQVVSHAKGNILSFERWGKYKLAYPIKHNEYAVYFLVRFEVSNEFKDSLLEVLTHLFAVKQGDLIMRHLVSKLKADQSLEYSRPDALEEAMSHNVDDFLRDNNMSGFLQNKSASKANLTTDDLGDIEELEELEIAE